MDFNWEEILDFNVDGVGSVNQPSVIKADPSPPWPSSWDVSDFELSCFEPEKDATGSLPLLNEPDLMAYLDIFEPGEVQQTAQELMKLTEFCERAPIHQGVTDFGNLNQVVTIPAPECITNYIVLPLCSPAEIQQPLQPYTVKIEVLGPVDTTSKPKAVPEAAQPTKPRKIKKVQTFTSQWNCEQCGRAFKSRGGLVQHNQQIHAGPTPHVCNICGKKFKDFDTMEQHRQRHLMKDKPFKCSECPKQFIRQSDLQRHIVLRHSVSPHQCDICGKVFDRADHLTDHKWSHVNGTVKKLKVQREV